MEITVMFEMEKEVGGKQLVNLPEITCGLQDLDCFRAMYGRKVKLKSIVPKVSAYEISALQVYLTEKEARKAGWFTDREQVQVCVTEDDAFLPYFYILPEKEREFVEGQYGSIDVSGKKQSIDMPTRSTTEH